MAKAPRDRKRSRSESDGGAAQAPVLTSIVINRILFAVALFGVLLTVHLWIQTQRGFDRGCLGFSDTVTVSTASLGCSAVAESDASRFLGVPNVIWGFLFYVGIAAISFGRTFVSEERARLLRRLTLVGAGAAFLFSVYLVIYQAFALEEFCVLCLISAATVTTLLGLSLWDARTGGPASPEARAVGYEIGLFGLTSFLGGAFVLLIVFFINGVGARGQSAEDVRVAVNQIIPEVIDPQFLRQMAPCSYADEPAPLANDEAFIYEEDAVLGNPDAPVTVIDFFDPNCPHCKTLHDALKPVVAQYGDRARFYYRPFPIWGFSTPQVQALYLAREQGLYFEMLEAQFEQQRQGGLDQAALVDIAEDIGLDVEPFREGLRSGKYLVQIQQEKQQIADAGVTSFPKLAIEGKFIPNTRQSMNPECIGALIEQEYRTLSASGAAGP